MQQAEAGTALATIAACKVQCRWSHDICCAASGCRLLAMSNCKLEVPTYLVRYKAQGMRNEQ